MTSTFRFGVFVDGNASGLTRATREAQQALERLGARGAAIAKRDADDYRRYARAREVLGIRSEREIQREIQRTEAAYNRLARAGTLSWQEQYRYARKTREEITRLTNEMGRLTTRQKIAAGAKGVAAVGAGVGVAAAMIAPKVQAAMDYDVRLAHLANTAFNDRDVAGRKAGMRDINAMIIEAVRGGGGTREGAADTAEALFGAGIFKPGEIRTILRDAVKAGTASNAAPTAFAQMAITANQTFGIQAERMSKIFGMGTYAGQVGGFEIKDMAKWLPQQMAAARAVGMSGEGGFAKLAALNQAAVVTAGTRDEAGNNVVNLLAKLGSQDTIKDFKKQGINLPKQLAEGRMKGLDALDVVGNLLQEQLGKDKNYQNVQKQLAGAKNDSERRAALESVGSIAQGTVIGKVFQDRQALMALYGFMQGRDRVGNIARDAMNNTDAVDRNFGLISSTAGYQTEQAKQASANALYESMSKLTPTVGGVSEKLANLMYQYPGYTTAITGATTALIALAGAAGSLALLNGGKAAGGLGRAGAALGTAAKWAGGVGLAGTVGYEIGSFAYKGMEENASGNLVGRGMANIAAFFGSKDAEDALTREANFDKQWNAQGARERMAGSGTASLPMLQQDLKGEIVLRVLPAPGLNVQADARTNSTRIPFRADTGRTNQAAGY